MAHFRISVPGSYELRRRPWPESYETFAQVANFSGKARKLQYSTNSIVQASNNENHENTLIGCQNTDKQQKNREKTLLLPVARQNNAFFGESRGFLSKKVSLWEKNGDS